MTSRAEIEARIEALRKARAPDWQIRSLEMALEPEPQKPPATPHSVPVAAPKPQPAIKHPPAPPAPAVALRPSARKLRDEMMAGGPVGAFFLEHASVEEFARRESLWARYMAKIVP